MRRAIRTSGLILRTILLLPFAIVVATPVLVFILVVYVWHLPTLLWSKHKWKSHLTQQGRFRNPQIVVSELGNGTLIVDSPTLGWGLLQCWWTPDDLRAITPHAVPTEDDRQSHIQSEPDELEIPFDRWVHTHYLNADTGSATLLATRHGDRFAVKCTKFNPALDVVNTWSGSIARSHEDKSSV